MEGFFSLKYAIVNFEKCLEIIKFRVFKRVIFFLIVTFSTTHDSDEWYYITGKGFLIICGTSKNNKIG